MGRTHTLLPRTASPPPADDCVFKDPTNETVGLSRYVKVPARCAVAR